VKKSIAKEVPQKMHSKIEKYRIILSRMAAVVVLFFLFTTQSLWETKNEVLTFFLFFIGMILVGIASLGRMWCSLYIAGYKDDKLVAKGPYSICRNPLYFFSMIGTLGIGFATETFTFPIIFMLLFAIFLVIFSKPGFGLTVISLFIIPKSVTAFGR
jgi:protein-S-isoprenylcysteine O-methyltransferase Ste14